ncbi:MAG TPA: 2-oxo-4-hydroxy-4-carboxy-5-ureidoimidazoline decarboxylase [Chloroflexota bacterium]|nr:2-oxo-4-hydroxy-4-carboxy-5-ureidoimidazoline decarboxylase [Chloroflexota bacterium]
MTALAPIESLNAMPCHEFVAALQPLFESAGPLGGALCARRPFRSYADLLDAAETVVRELSHHEQIELINAHPRIGAAPNTVSALSYREQGYAEENAAEMASTYQQLHQLNEEYEARFGFRFVVFVNKRPRSEIVDVLQQRLSGDPDEELQTAVHDMLEIARDRLRSLS